MKKIYLTMNLKTVVILFCLFFFGNAYSQVTDRNEKIEQVATGIRDQVYQNLKQQTGMSENNFLEFVEYYKDTIARNIGNVFTYLRMHPNINVQAEQNYIASKTFHYIQLYKTLQKIKVEFPSSVAEAISHKQFHNPTSTCNSMPLNLDFSSGTLTGWTVGYASTSSEDVGSCPPATGGPTNFSHTTPVFSTPGAVAYGAKDSNTGNSYQDSICSSGNDPVVGSAMPCVCPGFSHSCRIGDGPDALKGGVPNYGVAFLEQTFLVSDSSTDFQYHFAVVLNNPSHCYFQQPYFNIAILDQNGDTIPHCGNYNVVAGGANVTGAWQYLNKGTSTEVDYLNWTPGFVSLKKYLGQCITVVIIASDCGLGGHYGYAYFVAKCAPIDVIASSQATCGNPVTLTAPADGGAYQWSGPCITGSGTTQTVSVTCAGKYSVIVNNAISSSCADTLSTTVLVDVPSIHISSSPSNDTVCPGSSITLSGTGGKTYSWSGGVSNGIAFSPSISGKYVVTGTDSSGCSGKDSITVITGSGSLPVITATSIPASDTICKGSPVTLTGKGASYYNWSRGIKNGVSFSPSSSGKYVVTGTSTNGCSNTDTVNVVVKQGPVINISGQNLIIAGTSDTLTATGATSYIWSTGSTNDTTIVTPNSTTTYTITATGANGCSDTSSYTVTIKTVTGINTINNVPASVLYPNPANRILNLTFNTQGKALNAEIKIADITGKELIKLNSELKGNKTLPIDISSLSTGIYFISIETNSTVKTFKFIKN
jgi:hypothetical protein